MSLLFWIASATIILAATSFVRRQRGILEAAAVMVCSLPLVAEVLSRLSISSPVLVERSFPGIHGLESSPNWLGFVWLTGALFAFCRLAAGLVTVMQWRRRSVPLDSPTAQRIAGLVNASPIRVVRQVRVSSDIATPMVVPGWPSTILLPQDWTEWSDDLRTASIHHEWHHLMKRDGWRTLALAVFSAVWWFHPLALWLRHYWQDQTELEADEAATRRSDPTIYATALLDIASAPRTGSWVPVLSVGFAAVGRHRLERRIAAILKADHRLPSQNCSGPAVVGLLCLGAFLAWTGCNPLSSPPAETGSRVDEARLRLTAEPFPADS